MSSIQKPKLTFWQIWNMSFGFLGIQFGFALQNANVSRIFETLGAKIDEIPILWIAAPVTGLIIQPIIGHLSDNTWGKLGRRRPYFLVGAVLASLALLIMPNSPTLWIAAGMLWIMDASINISMEPFRAFVGDMLPSEQRTLGFSMQSFFIGIGAIIASALPYIMTNWLGFSNISAEGEIPQSVKFSFYIGAIIFFLAVLWTVISSKEYSPDELKKYTSESSSLNENNSILIDAKRLFLFAFCWVLIGILGFIVLYFFLHETDFGLYVLFVGSFIFGLVLFTASFFQTQKCQNSFLIVINDLLNMPKTMKQLAVVQFFSWFALFAMWIYTTPAVTHHIYGTDDPLSHSYNEGADWVGVLMSVYNGFAAIMAFFLIWLAKKTNRKTVHAISLSVGALSLLSFYFIKNPQLLLISELGIGLAWASILAMPYAILAGSIPASKMGTYMGIFNFFIVIPQITAAAILGFFVRNIFANEAIYALLLGGFSMIIAAVAVIFVDDKDA